MTDTLENISRLDDARFEKEIDALMREAEALRLGAMKTHRSRGFVSMSVGLSAVIAGAAGFGWLFLIEGDLLKALGAIILGIVIAAALHFWSAQALNDYKAQYKSRFLPKLAKTLGGFQYHPVRGIRRKIIEKTGVIPPHEIYTAEDCFMGRYKGTKVIFSEARLQHKQAGRPPIFDGLFALLEVPQDVFKGHTIITADQNMVQKWRNSRWKKLQDVDFVTGNSSWDRFTIVSDTPDETQKFLNDALLKELAETADVFDNSSMSAVLFRKKFIFLMIPYDGNMFEPSDIYVPITTKRHAAKCKKEVGQLLEIIDIFDLYGERPTTSAPAKPLDHP